MSGTPPCPPLAEVGPEPLMFHARSAAVVTGTARHVGLGQFHGLHGDVWSPTRAGVSRLSPTEGPAGLGSVLRASSPRPHAGLRGTEGTQHDGPTGQGPCLLLTAQCSRAQRTPAGGGGRLACVTEGLGEQALTVLARVTCR